MPDASVRPLRVVHGPCNVGNLPWVLSGAMQKLGHHSKVVVNYSTWLGYPADVVVGNYAEATWANASRRLATGLRQPLANDVLHYYFGRSFMSWEDLGGFNRFPFADMRLAKQLGRTVVMTYQGCDARLAGQSNQRNEVTPCAPEACSAFATCVSSIDASRKQTIQTVDDLADLVLYVNPELGHFLPRGHFLPYGNVDVEAIVPEARPANQKPVLLHAPSDPAIKGTQAIVQALDALKTEFDFELQLVKGVPHAEAMTLYRRADLLIDQVLAGWYGGLAVELMAMGIPAACYLRDSDLHLLPAPMRQALPVQNIDPRRLVDDLRALLSRRAEWPELGRRSREFVMRWHHPGKLASVLLAAYRDPKQYPQLLAEMN